MCRFITTEAPRIAAESTQRYRLVAIARLGKSIWIGTNRPGRHAEVAAIKQVPYERRSDVSLTVLRYRKDNDQLALAKPCKACQAFLSANKVTTIFYSTDDLTLARL